VKSVLPPDLAQGPADDSYGARRAWLNAGTQWSRANGYGWSGWQRLLDPQVRRRYAARARERSADLLDPDNTYVQTDWDRYVSRETP
jgi:hypothetical protein